MKCLVCETPIEAKRSHKKYCGSSCKLIAYTLRKNRVYTLKKDTRTIEDVIYALNYWLLNNASKLNTDRGNALILLFGAEDKYKSSYDPQTNQYSLIRL